MRKVFLGGFIVGSAALVVLFQNATVVSVIATEAEVSWPTLKRELKGYAASTIGGLNGKLVYVTDFRDYASGATPIPGTLRHVIETSDKAVPLWVKFKVGASAKTIYLQRYIKLRSNLTIDGRGTGLIISNKINWSLYKVKDPYTTKRGECAKIDPDMPSTHLFILENTKNVILTNFRLTREGFNLSPWDVGGTAPKLYPNMDKECLGDMISIYDRRKEGQTTVNAVVSTNIWLNRLTIQYCGDGCIDVARPDFAAHNISISNNRFIDTDKNMILGTPYSVIAPKNPNGTLVWDIPGSKVPHPFRVAIYGNWFQGVKQRNPKAMSAIAHIYNNFYDRSGTAVTALKSKVFYEENLFTPLVRAVEHYDADYDGDIYSYNNLSTSYALMVPNTKGYIDYRSRWIPGAVVSKASTLTPNSFSRDGADSYRAP